jgi:hypothetical protein
MVWEGERPRGRFGAGLPDNRSRDARPPIFHSFRRSHPAPVEEFQSRIDTLRTRMEELRLSHLVVYGDREHFANLAYLTNFDPRFEEALLVIGPESKPLLVVGNECEAYLPISPLFQHGSLRTERYQPFSLLDQPRDRSRSLEDIFRSEKIVAGTHVGCVGWKYYGNPHQMDVPSFIVDVLRGIVGFDNVTDATRLLSIPARVCARTARHPRSPFSNIATSRHLKP